MAMGEAAGTAAAIAAKADESFATLDVRILRKTIAANGGIVDEEEIWKNPVQ